MKLLSECFFHDGIIITITLLPSKKVLCVTLKSRNLHCLLIPSILTVCTKTHDWLRPQKWEGTPVTIE